MSPIDESARAGHSPADGALSWATEPRFVEVTVNGQGRRRKRSPAHPTTLVLRGACPADRPALAAMHARCSLDTLLRRYLTMGPALCPEVQERLVRSTVAIAAVDARGGLHGLGTLSAVTPQGADLDLLVEDRYQGCGLGTSLAAVLAEAARRCGCRAVTMQMLPSTTAAARIAARLGPVSHSGGPDVLTCTVPLRDVPRARPVAS